MNDPLLIDSQKLLLHPKRVSQWQDNKFTSFPIYVEISPVGACNHRCTFCAVDYLGYKNTNLKTEVLGTFLEDAAELGVKSILFAGEGEPLFHKDLANLISFAKVQGIDVAITTNGTMLTSRFIKDCLESITWLRVSMNGGTPECYSQIHKTKEDDFYKVWENLDYAVDFKEFSKLKTTIGIQCVLLPENEHTIHGLALQAICTGLDYLIVKTYSHNPASITQDYKNLKYEKYDEFITKLESLNTASFKVIGRREAAKNLFLRERGYQKCLSTPYFWAYLKSDGNLVACSAHMLEDKFILGNINEKSFKEIWLGEKRRELMRYMINELDISTCRLNCRMNKVNEYLWELENPGNHANFI